MQHAALLLLVNADENDCEDDWLHQERDLQGFHAVGARFPEHEDSLDGDVVG